MAACNDDEVSAIRFLVTVLLINTTARPAPLHSRRSWCCCVSKHTQGAKQCAAAQLGPPHSGTSTHASRAVAAVQTTLAVNKVVPKGQLGSKVRTAHGAATLSSSQIQPARAAAILAGLSVATVMCWELGMEGTASKEGSNA
jgi:hypothetical protein